ncbi:MAG: acylneuraminate cytidylyltransferase family protein [Bdellovibrionales bacterium]|nr:acylneuraminate cytidylyltransferase family protein [Bdellovibrionales bacterium]
MKRLCTLCARGGSKGVPGKNVRMLSGRPLLEISILQAKKSGLFEAVAVSSDSEEILGIAKNAGADLVIRRPAELATDTAGKIPAIRHAFLESEKILATHFDVLVDLDATSPLRMVSDIQGAVALLEKSGAGNVITGAVARRSPYFNLVEDRGDGTVGLAKVPAKPILRRQDAPKCFDMNASIYVWTRAGILQRDTLFHSDTRIFEMPEDRSLDIDSELDFQVVEFIVSQRKRFQDAW